MVRVALHFLNACYLTLATLFWGEVDYTDSKDMLLINTFTSMHVVTIDVDCTAEYSGVHFHINSVSIFVPVWTNKSRKFSVLHWRCFSKYFPLIYQTIQTDGQIGHSYQHNVRCRVATSLFMSIPLLVDWPTSAGVISHLPLLVR